MNLTLTKIEERVIGALIEKGLTTPDYYPLTLNSLTAACNQKSNRNPVVDFDEKTVLRSLDSLKERGLARMQSGADMRVPKYYHRFDEVGRFSGPEVAIMCELMLRGPQTVGELRGRASRMHEFADLAQVESVLLELANRADGPAVKKLPRRAGHKESRYAHLLAGEPEVASDPDAEPAVEGARLEVVAENERMDRLEETVTALQGAVDEIRQQLTEFKKQFE